MPKKIDDSFALTTKLLFGKPLGPLSKYEKWIEQRLPGGKLIKSCFGKGTAFVPNYGALKQMDPSKVASEEDISKANTPIIQSKQDASSLALLFQKVGQSACFVPFYAEGKNLEVESSFLYFNCTNIKNCFDPFTSKNCAYVFSIMDSDSLFGAFRTIASFSIHCYNSYHLQRCFEMDGAKNCRDCYFCHNVEDLQDCMFCFNTKGKRYAIGNLEVGREKYLQFKQRFLAFILQQLETKNRLDFDIYDILCAKKKTG